MPLPVDHNPPPANRRSDNRERDDRSQGRGYRDERRDARQDIEQARRRVEGGLPPPPHVSGGGGGRGRQSNERGVGKTGDRHERQVSRDRPSESLNRGQSPSKLHRGQSPSQRLEHTNGSGAHGAGASRTPPGASRTPPPHAKPSGPVNSLVAELRRAGQSLLGISRGSPVEQLAQQQSSGSDEEDMEAGEIPAEEAEPGSEYRKRRLSPPDVAGGLGKAARTNVQGGGPHQQSMLNRVFEDVASFKLQQAELNFDPDAPAAVKSSPSVSGSDSDDGGVHAKMRKRLEEAAAAAAEIEDRSASGSEGDEAQKSRVTSRWMVDNDAGGEDEKPGGREAEGGGGDGEHGQSSSGGFDSEEDDDSLPPSPRTSINRTYNMLQECRSVDEFEKINRISEGTYGVVYKAREKSTGRLVALKRIKMEKEKDGFPVTSIREINVLLNFHHPNMVHVSEIVISYRNPDHIFMVMELMDHDLKGLMEPKGRLTRPFSIAEVKCLMLQLLRGTNFMHENWVLHRDLKPANILYSSKGELKICDFGLARQYGSPLKPYTQMVVTLWYRSPELLLGTKTYSTAVDIWSVGCIMGELLLGAPVFPGQSELDQLDKIVSLLGTPSEEMWPGLKALPNFGKVVLKQMISQLRSKFQNSFGGAVVTEAGFELLSQLLAWDPEKRISADAALKHRWFSEAPLPQKQELMPTFAARRE